MRLQALLATIAVAAVIGLIVLLATGVIDFRGTGTRVPEVEEAAPSETLHPNPERPVEVDRATGVAAPAASDADGQVIFAQACSACHGGDGEGGLGPRLAGNRNLERPDYLFALVLRGGDGMPSFANRLSQEEIAAVVDFARNSWGNEFGHADPSLFSQQTWPHLTSGPQQLYAVACARCHGGEGGGDIGPALDGNENLADPQYVAGKILHGRGGMPAFEGILSPLDVTAVAEFVRNSWSNEFGEVPVEKVLALLSHPPGDGNGSLLVTVTPRSARLTVVGPNGFVRYRSEGGPLELEGLGPGTYIVSAAAGGYGSGSVTAQVGREVRTVVSLMLGQEDEGAERPHQPRPSLDEVVFLTGMTTSDGSQLRALSLYQSSCSLCHGASGEGGVGPALAGNANLESADFLIDTILHGRRAMPGFSQRLGDEEIAALATHERTSWGNAFGRIGPGQVADLRGDAGPEQEAEAAPGQELYAQHCQACHGNGSGSVVAPGFRNNARLGDPGYVLSRIVMGGGGMPAFDGVLSTSEMAQVAGFIRTSWGNDFGAISISRAEDYHGGTSSLER